jgi:hypothetical protein
VILASPPPSSFIAALREFGVEPIAVGRVIVATWAPHDATVLDVIRKLGLELQVIFNKGAVMVLPSGVNKATGLQAALSDLGLSPHNVAGIGDAENDFAFLKSCECSAAVANALDSIKHGVDIVTDSDHGAGVREFVGRIVDSDLAGMASERHRINIGTASDEAVMTLPAYGERILIAGESGSGKSNLATTIIEQLSEQRYQFCVIDPEGDYDKCKDVTVAGDPHRAPAPEDVVQLLRNPAQNVVVNLMGIEVGDRPDFFHDLLSRLAGLRAATGRPHWVLVDEAHHVLPSNRKAFDLAPLAGQSCVYIAVDPKSVAEAVCRSVTCAISVGSSIESTARSMADAIGHPNASAVPELASGEVLLATAANGWSPIAFTPMSSRTERKRHRRKYSEGRLGRDKSFYFRGPSKQVNIRAYNLMLFIEISKGVDAGIWQYHLDRGDYSAWFRNSIKDEDLAEEVEAAERSGLPANETRRLIEEAINHRYTIPAYQQ